MNFLKQTLLLLILSTSIKVSFAQASVLPNLVRFNEYEYGISNHPLPTTQQARFSYMWWFGDGGYSFRDEPNHRFLNDIPGEIYSGKLVMTESYGTGGVPPMVYQSAITNTGAISTSVTSILENNRVFKVQHYRNAVPNDTLYLIVTYKNPDNSNSVAGYRSGTIRLFLDEDYLEYDVNMNSRNHHPKGELKDPDALTWKFDDLNGGVETSFLVALKASDELVNKYEERLAVKGTIEFNQGTQDLDEIEIPVARSHDPNLMTNDKLDNKNCAIGGEVIRYHIDFENQGTAPTSFIKLDVDLDQNLKLSSIRNITSSKNYATYSGGFINQYNSSLGRVMSTKVDVGARKLLVSLNGFRLESGYVLNRDFCKGWVEFDVEVNPGYTIGQDIVSNAAIYFDSNPAVETNDSVITCTKGKKSDQVIPVVKFPTKWIGFGGAFLIVTLIGIFAIRRKRKKEEEEVVSTQ